MIFLDLNMQAKLEKTNKRVLKNEESPFIDHDSKEWKEMKNDGRDEKDYYIKVWFHSSWAFVCLFCSKKKGDILSC